MQTGQKMKCLQGQKSIQVLNMGQHIGYNE